MTGLSCGAWALRGARGEVHKLTNAPGGYFSAIHQRQLQSTSHSPILDGEWRMESERGWPDKAARDAGLLLQAPSGQTFWRRKSRAWGGLIGCPRQPVSKPAAFLAPSTRPGLAGRAPERADGMGGHRGRCADLQQYTLAAERRSVLSGRGGLDLPVLKEALRHRRGGPDEWEPSSDSEGGGRRGEG